MHVVRLKIKIKAVLRMEVTDKEVVEVRAKEEKEFQ